ncbi:Methyltransferase domain, partial [Rhizoctonia solani]
MELTTSSPDVVIRHGRQFHKTKSNYGLPNDEGEHTRLNYQNEALKMMLGANYTAPMQQLNAGEGPLDVLDVASGSGIWAIEMAREFPKAQVVGIDMSNPGALLPFDDQSFDVVQMRIVPSIHERTSIYKEIHRVLRPGGFIQLVEPSPHTSRVGRTPPAMDETDQAIIRCGHKSESKGETARQRRNGNDKDDWSMGNRIASDLRRAPSMWMSIHETLVVVPIGVWTQDEVSREAGRLMQHCAVELIKGFRPNLIDDAGLTEGEVDSMITKLGNELEDGSRWQLQAPFHFVWAVKT